MLGREITGAIRVIVVMEATPEREVMQVFLVSQVMVVLVALVGLEASQQDFTYIYLLILLILGI